MSSRNSENALQDRVMSQPGSWLLRIVALGLLWLLLTEAVLRSWVVGVPCVLAAAWASRSLRFLTPWRFSISGTLRFLAFFVIESLRAGIYVARRAMAPGRLDLAPGVVEYRTQLPPGAPRLLLLYAISMLPGTLTVEWDGAVLQIHVLDERSSVIEDVLNLESRVRGVVRHEMPVPKEA